jgi:hypothetical protein
LAGVNIVIKIKYLITVFLFIIIILAACQPTPQDVIIVNKNDDKLMEIIEGGQKTKPDSANESAKPEPTTWKEELIISENLSVSVNAKVSIPDVASFPVYQIEPDRFDVDSVTRIKKTLFKDAQLYHNDPSAGRLYTKTEIEQKIIKIELQLSDPNSNINQIDNFGSEEERKKARQRLEDELRYLKEQHHKAPEKIEYDPIEITHETLEKGLFSIINQDNGTVGFYVSDVDDDMGRHNSITCYYPHPSEESMEQYEDLSVEKAEDIAMELVNKLGADMSLYCTILVNKIDEKNYRCYDVIFTKTYNGIPETYTEQDQADIRKDEKTYTCPWFYEKIIVRVDNFGVWFFQWYSPSKIVKTMSENVAMLSFDQVKKIFKDQIGYSNAWIDKDDHIILRKLFITEVKLGMMRVSIKDSIDKYMVIPVWDFFGYTVDKYDAQQPGGYALDENNEYTNAVEAHSFLTVNSIDGSVIDRNLGY